jgi:flagellar biosynthesis protein FlhB
MAERSQASRTEEPTPRRLAEARRQGQVAVSRELTGAVALAAAFVVLVAAASAGAGQLIGYLRAALTSAARGGDAGAALATGLRQAVALLALPLGLGLVATVVAGVAQTGGLFTLAPVRPDCGRLAPALGRLLDGATFLEAGKGAAKAAVLLGLGALTLMPLAGPLAALAGASAGRVLAAAGVLAAALGWRLVTASVVFGALDLVWQRHRHRRGLRMTREEAARERRQQEGDPRHRAERQRLHRSLSQQGGVEDVRQADFVVSGDDHAVALRHRELPVPVVIAAGERLLAARIKELARSSSLPIFPDPGLARALAAVPEGAEIPEALYEPIARIVKVLLEGSRR